MWSEEATSTREILAARIIVRSSGVVVATSSFSGAVSLCTAPRGTSKGAAGLLRRFGRRPRRKCYIGPTVVLLPFPECKPGPSWPARALSTDPQRHARWGPKRQGTARVGEKRWGGGGYSRQLFHHGNRVCVTPLCLSGGGGGGVGGSFSSFRGALAAFFPLRGARAGRPLPAGGAAGSFGQPTPGPGPPRRVARRGRLRPGDGAGLGGGVGQSGVGRAGAGAGRLKRLRRGVGVAFCFGWTWASLGCCSTFLFLF